MDFEREAREIDSLLDAELPRHMFRAEIANALRKAFTAGQESMRGRSADMLRDHGYWTQAGLVSALPTQSNTEGEG